MTEIHYFPQGIPLNIVKSAGSIVEACFLFFTQTSTLTACDPPGPSLAVTSVRFNIERGHENKLCTPVAPLKEQTFGNAALWTSSSRDSLSCQISLAAN